MFNFQKKLKQFGLENKDENKAEAPEKRICKLHHIPECESCFNIINKNDDFEVGNSWLAHKLKFEKDYKGKDLLQKRDSIHDYVVVDPRIIKNKESAIETGARKMNNMK